MFGFPLLLIPLAICNIIVFLMPTLLFSEPLVTVPLLSGVSWTITLSDVVLAFAILMLMCEVIKGARPGGKYFTDHFLALLVFAGAAAEFVLLPQFGTSMFFLLALLALVDFLSGIALRARRPRRVVSVAPAPEPVVVATPAPVLVNREPSFAPAPVASGSAIPMPPPAPTPAKLRAQVEPIVPDESATDTKRDQDSPQIASPGLAPGGVVHRPPESPPRS